MPIVNGLKIPILENQTINDVIEKFFDMRCEFIVNKNSKPIPSHRYRLCRVKENDIIQIISYSKNNYKINKRTIFRSEQD